MRLLLDEHYSPRVADRLRRLGHDVTTVRESTDVGGLPDADVLEVAVVQRRAVVTENVADFVALHRARFVAGRRHFGLIFTSPRRFPRTTPSIGRLVAALDAFLSAHPSEEALVDQAWWLDPVSR